MKLYKCEYFTIIMDIKIAVAILPWSNLDIHCNRHKGFRSVLISSS